MSVESFTEFLGEKLIIDSIHDPDIVAGYEKDSSNLPGNAKGICRPKNELECAVILAASQQAKIPLTISAGRTNLTGSATPNGGVVLSIENLLEPDVQVNMAKKTVTSAVGIYLEDMRKAVLSQSGNTLHYPVDPTSREEAMVGGTLSCNASGFIPGPAGATRYWVDSLDFLLPNGYKISCSRGQYITNDGEFIIKIQDNELSLPLPKYKRPKIKNASGPYSSENGKMDLVDLIVGSEGLFGLITAVTFKLQDSPDGTLDMFFTLSDEGNAIKFHQYIQDYYGGDLSKITALEYFGYNCLTYMNHKEELFNSNEEVGIYMQIPLYKETIETAAEKWQLLLRNSNCGINEDGILLLNDPRNWRTFFEARHSIPANALDKTHRLDTWSILTDTIVPPKNFPAFLQAAHTMLQDAEIEYLLFGHLGDCHLHFHLIPIKAQQPAALEIYAAIVAKSAELGGIYSAEHGTGKRKRMDFIQCYGEDAVEQIRQTKSALDPHFLLNRGNVINPEVLN